MIKRVIIFQLVILFLISPSAFLTPLMVSRTFSSEVWRLTAGEMTYSLGMVLFDPLADIVRVQTFLVMSGTVVVVISIGVYMTSLLE